MPLVNEVDVGARILDPGLKQLVRDLTSAANGLTALAGGGQANAAVLTAQVNRVTTVATAADSVKLPPAKPGQWPLVVINAAAANSMNVFPSSGDAINAVAADGAFAVAANKTVLFFCAVAGIWNAITTA
jgi:hypothetical protein